MVAAASAILLAVSDKVIHSSALHNPGLPTESKPLAGKQIGCLPLTDRELIERARR